MESIPMNILKLFMFFFNFIFFICGFSLIVIGGLVHSRYGDYFSYLDPKYTNAAAFIIGIGLIVFIIGFLGCCGAVREDYKMVTAFAILLGVIFVLEIIAACMGFQHKKDVNRVVDAALKKAVDGYGKVKGDKKLLDWVQSRLHCCGFNGSRDFDKGNSTHAPCGKGQGVPSCHKGGTCKGDLYTKGCPKEFSLFIKREMGIIAGVALAIAIVQLIGIVFACVLRRGILAEYQVL